MNVYRSFSEIPRDTASVITVGTFDGVHLGHRSIIARLLETARNEKLRPVLITIDPHPQIVLNKNKKHPVKLLTTIEERIDILAGTGLENLMILPFSEEFAKTPPRDFVENFLFGEIGFSKILIGYDHMFGRNREGNSGLLNEMGAKLGFEVEKIDALSDGDVIVSSTKIRNSLYTGDVKSAREMLGYDYLVRGRIVHGQGRAMRIGYPTANLEPASPYKLLPGTGVYLVTSEIDGKNYYGMANLGYRPTLTNDTETTLESHYFGYEGDLYGREIDVVFLDFLRKERKFPSLDHLIAQINLDKQKCFDLIEKRKNNFSNL
jgi:riboflavin kinase/FMN adenylyltransferase